MEVTRREVIEAVIDVLHEFDVSSTEEITVIASSVADSLSCPPDDDDFLFD